MLGYCVAGHQNFLLGQLGSSDLTAIQPHLTTVSLRRGKVLAEPGQHIDHVYFPHSGALSFLVDLPEGGTIETGMMGRDGVFGATQALDERISLNRVTVQLSGEASIVRSTTFCKLALDMPRFRKLILSYDQFFFSYVQQTSACNAVHNVRQRYCRWLLRMHELVGTEFNLTQELLAQMMGVRRTSVSAVAQELQSEGLVRYRRGRINVVNLDKLRSSACGCEHEVNEHFVRLFDRPVSEQDLRSV